jgi:hypothetical protein
MNSFSTKTVKEVLEFPVGLGVQGIRLTDVKVIEPQGKAGYSIGFEFSYLPKTKLENGEIIENKKDPNYGAKTLHRLFEPDTSRTPDQVEKATQQVLASIKHVFGAVIKEEDFNIDSIEALTFKEYISKVAETMKKFPIDTIPLKLKVIYNKQNYVSLPAYPNFISSPIKPRELKADPNYDFFEKRKNTPDGLTNIPVGGIALPGGFELPSPGLGDGVPF